jgi:hypothetical protein
VNLTAIKIISERLRGVDEAPLSRSGSYPCRVVHRKPNYGVLTIAATPAADALVAAGQQMHVRANESS